jgi:hypothetical protein
MRETGVIPWGWVADNTRWLRQRTMFTSPEHILQSVAATYRRDLWARQPVHVEVWCESDSIAGVLDDITLPARVALFACRGQSSKTFVFEAAQTYVALGKPVVVLYVGDWDPSGLAVPNAVEDRMARYTDGLEVQLRRIAVLPEDVAEGTYTSHPVNTRDPNHSQFEARCLRLGLDPMVAVEVEALPPDDLRQRLRGVIDALTDLDAWAATLVAEQSERDLLQRMVAGDVAAYRQLVAS